MHYPVQDNSKTNRATGIFYFTDEAKLVSCRTLLDTNRYTYHMEQDNKPVELSEPPPRESGQVKNCNATPVEFVFTDTELAKIVSKGHNLHENPPNSMAMPQFVSLHKIFSVSCLLWAALLKEHGTCSWKLEEFSSLKKTCSSN